MDLDGLVLRSGVPLPHTKLCKRHITTQGMITTHNFVIATTIITLQYIWPFDYV